MAYSLSIPFFVYLLVDKPVAGELEIKMQAELCWVSLITGLGNRIRNPVSDKSCRDYRVRACETKQAVSFKVALSALMPQANQLSLYQILVQMAFHAESDIYKECGLLFLGNQTGLKIKYALA